LLCVATALFKLLHKYRPEDKAQKAERLKQAAAAAAAGAAAPKEKKPVVLKYGLNHLTALVEQNKAQLVIIAHDVDPIELVLWLPALCRKRNVPYCIVKSKSRLGQLVHKKTATAVALTGVRKEDEAELAQLVQAVRGSFNERYDEIRRTWGGNVMGIKAQHKIDARAAALRKDVVGKFAS
jgi:large subunit ribosomal protein L7Ae